LQFDSLTFVVFFLLVSTGYWQLRVWRWRKVLLLAASYLFYAAWNPLFLPLLIGTSLLDWRLALFLDQASSARRRRWLMLSIITINLSVLGFFKYWNFFADNLNAILDAMSWRLPLHSDIALPIGISFYTFHSLSYCIDIHRRKITAVKSLLDYLLYIAFFPQLVAGPIVRWTTMGRQLAVPTSFNIDRLGVGLLMMLVGLFEKVVLADRIFAPVADHVFAHDGAVSGAESWVGALSFAGQIFADFAGYTTCALGAALVLGFELPLNFKAPYAALGFSDFWRRWHISLSSWLRDYLYISLGGSRKGQLITYRNLMLTMLLGGLWHGAAWTFIVWGGAHGLLLVLERVAMSSARFAKVLLRTPVSYLYRVFTFLIVTVLWVYFRAEDLSSANSLVAAMLTDFRELSIDPKMTFEFGLALAVLGLMLSVQWLMRETTLRDVIESSPSLVQGIVAGVMLFLIVSMPGEGNAFIYFQF
jgi:D-alanyl-lipoteichoic acid acyltransferase DltB (MBOAT superfamily)